MTNADELSDPRFLAYLTGKYRGTIEPKAEDFDSIARPRTEAEKAEQYRLAQAAAILRIHRDWKSIQK